MITLEQFIDDPAKYIWGDDCCLHIDSIFEREFKGDLKLLLSCCEDNAVPEGINYYQAIKDYEENKA